MPPAAPILILTRPEPAARRFAGMVAAAFGQEPETLFSPLLRIAPVAVAPVADVAALVLTSENAVPAARRLFPGGGLTAWCVGPRTATAARAAGFLPRDGGGTAQALIDRLVAERPGGVLLYLRGREVRVDVAAQLAAAGLTCVDRVAYDQRPRPLSDAARAALRTPGRPCVLPVFSPATGAALARSGPFAAALHVIAMSPDVAESVAALDVSSLDIAARPDAEAMAQETVARLAQLSCDGRELETRQRSD